MSIVVFNQRWIMKFDLKFEPTSCERHLVRIPNLWPDEVYIIYAFMHAFDFSLLLHNRFSDQMTIKQCRAP